MPDSNPAKTIVKLVTKFVEYQGKRIIGENFAAEVMNTLTEYAGDDATERLTAFFDQGTRADQLAAAFTEADNAFAKTIDDPDLAHAIQDLRLARLPSLEKIAGALPQTLDNASLLAALRARFAGDYPHLTSTQLDHAARVYRDCLDRTLAAKCDQLGVWTYLGVKQLGADQKRLIEKIDSLGRGHVWQRPPPPRAESGFVGRATELGDVRKLIAPGTRTAITATIHGSPGVGKTWLARQLAVELDAQFPRGVIFQKLGSGHRTADQCAPILAEWMRVTGYPLLGQLHLKSILQNAHILR